MLPGVIPLPTKAAATKVPPTRGVVRGRGGWRLRERGVGRTNGTAAAEDSQMSDVPGSPGETREGVGLGLRECVGGGGGAEGGGGGGAEGGRGGGGGGGAEGGVGLRSVCRGERV